MCQMKPNFTHYKTKHKSGASFWDQEYKTSGYLALSDDPSEDLIKFTRFLGRLYGEGHAHGGRAGFINQTSSVLDLGCGNGRNLIYLAETFGTTGVGYDVSGEAVAQARKKSEKLPITYTVRSIAKPIPLADESQDIVLDMMTSHFLNEQERAELLKEIHRVLKPGGWFFYKTFLLDEDRHAARLLKDHPTNEPGTYLHPQIGVAEHVSTETEILTGFAPYFEIHKVGRSHRHRARNAKRRSISVFAEKIR